MKKLLFFIFIALFCAGAFAQELPKIAVYVTGDVPNNEKEALGTRILTSLVNSGRYIAIERSKSFLAEIEKEHTKQRSGDIDDGQISALGKQFGVKYICIAAITPVLGEFQVSARIVDVETAVVIFIGEAFSPMKTTNDLALVSDQAVKNMFSGRTTPASKPEPAKPKPQTVQQTARNVETATTFTDRRDGKVYKKVAIGGQVWMAENLNYAADDGKCYENKSSKCEEYGRLYNWATANKACPAGYHLPNDDEWNTLIGNVGGTKTAGKKLKSTIGWKKNTGTDAYGFSALPGGYGNSDGYFDDAGYDGYWWSATESYAGLASRRDMYFNNEGVYKYNDSKTGLFSVRCVQD